MKVSEQISKFLAAEELTQASLAALLGVDASAVSNWISGRRQPDKWALLMLAAISSNRLHREYFLAESQVTSTELAMLSALLQGRPAEKDVQKARIAAVVAWLESPPRDPTDESVREMVYGLAEFKPKK